MRRNSTFAEIFIEKVAKAVYFLVTGREITINFEQIEVWPSTMSLLNVSVL